MEAIDVLKTALAVARFDQIQARAQMESFGDLDTYFVSDEGKKSRQYFERGMALVDSQVEGLELLVLREEKIRHIRERWAWLCEHGPVNRDTEEESRLLQWQGRQIVGLS